MSKKIEELREIINRAIYSQTEMRNKEIIIYSTLAFENYLYWAILEWHNKHQRELNEEKVERIINHWFNKKVREGIITSGLIDKQEKELAQALCEGDVWREKR